jgi:hypothetical protein
MKAMFKKREIVKNNLKKQSHEKVGKMGAQGDSLGPN